jgi:replicative DNA helicase
MRLETTILKNLIRNDEYTRKVLPFIKEEYFGSLEDKLLFGKVSEFIEKFNTNPTFDALTIEVENIRGTSDETVKKIVETIDEIRSDKVDTNLDWLIESTEKFCQERAIFNAITSSLEIMNGSNKQLSKGAIPQLLSDALAITFDPNVGHDYFSQAENRYEYYHRVEERIPFDLDYFNKITKGGLPRKTLNVVMGGVHTGKSLFLCHFAASYLAQGKNVLYITLEMAEEEITKRIDVNLLNLDFDDLDKLSKDMFLSRVGKFRQKTHGNLIVKEYAATTASVIHFRALLNELQLKKNFTPDIILIDYLNICASSRIKASQAGDTYTYIKSIAEEVRGLAQQTSIPIWSATQLTRSGFGSTDPDMTDVAESFGLPATVDMLLVLISTEQLKQLNQIMVKQLKNRYSNLEDNKRFVVGVDKKKMRLYDLDDSAQEDIVDSGQQTTPAQNVKQFKPSVKDKFKGIKV